MAKVIGERIRSYRLRRNLTQDALGELADVHGKYIGQVERGEKNATIESIGKIAKALDVSLALLLENIVVGQTDNRIPQECYNLITSMNEKEQAIILDIIKRAVEFKRV